MALRRLCAQGAAVLRRQGAVDDIATSIASGSRRYSVLPEDIADAARKARFPPKRPRVVPAAVEGAGQLPAAPINVAQEGARIATNWMFPWERRQMEGGALRPWEKLYWGVFVVAISALLFGRLRTPAPAPPAPELEEAKAAAKAERARAVAAGGSVTQGEDDPFDGLAPEEIQRFVEEATGAKDPFEGMSPEEINAQVMRQGA